jgi:hypothetical protein
MNVMPAAITRRSAFELGKPSLVERAVRRLRHRDCYGRVPLAPQLDARQIELVEQLRCDGTLVLESYIKPEHLAALRAETQHALEDLKFETPCLAQSRLDRVRHADLLDNFLLATPEQFAARGAAFDRGDVHSLDQVVRDFEPSTLTLYMLEGSQSFRDLWLDPWLLTIIAHYLGLVPKLMEAYVRRNFPARYWTMNHYWHRDLNDPHQLVKVFVFLSDCSVDNGPHEFVRGSHRNFSRLNGQRYYTDADIDRAYPPGSPERLVSEVKAGTVIVEDTRGLHRARMPVTGHRDLGYAVFFPLADGSEPSCYKFPSHAFEALTPFQRAFIPAADLC